MHVTRSRSGYRARFVVEAGNQPKGNALRASTKKLLAGVAVIALFTGACGNDDEDAATGTGTETGTNGEAGEGITVTVTDDSIEVPSEVAAGVVTVTIEGGDPFAEVDFSRVTSGTTEEEFEEGFLPVINGGPFPDFFEANAGALAGQTSEITLEPGEYIVWTEEPSGDEEDDGGEGEEPDVEAESAQAEETTTTVAEDGEGEDGEGEDGGEDEISGLLTASMTVTDGDVGELPSTDGTITAQDYEFSVDVQAGDRFTFRNEGPDQLHHAVLFSFGDLDPAVVEENIPGFFAEEDAPPPEAFADLDFENFEAGGSAVFSAGLGGTFDAVLESGTTYAAVCFISDKTGGPPHVAAYDMYEVFQVS